MLLLKAQVSVTGRLSVTEVGVVAVSVSDGLARHAQQSGHYCGLSSICMVTTKCCDTLCTRKHVGLYFDCV